MRWMASPKQPQSFTVLLSANPNVTSVMNTMKIKVSREVWRRRMANKSKIPKVNSKAESATDVPNNSNWGTAPVRWSAPK